jgi:exonuclease SbcD
MSRFLCCGDLHLDAGPDLGRAPGDRLHEQEEVWRRCLEIAAEENVEAVLFAGDAFHKARPSPEAMLAFERPLLVESRHLRPMVAILGNHDVAGVSLGTGLEVFAEAGLLTLAREPAIHAVAGVSIACLPWVAASRVVAAHGGGDRDDINAQAAELLLATARGLRAQIDGPAILLTHFSISGSSLPNGLPVEQLREPVLQLGDLEALGFDAVIAGHIHVPAQLGDDQRVIYVGSPLPLNFGEADVRHGVWIVETNPFDARFVRIASRLLETLDYDEPPGAPYEVAEALVMEAIVKVRVKATPGEARRFDVAAFKRALYDSGAEKVWSVQLEIERPERARVEGLSEELDELAALELWMEASGVNGTRAQALRERTEKYLGLVRT